ncbi:MAG: formylglycine-generating enzyme family protein [Ignavibacteriales bacterium]|nr:formylglycine-generating enzyme family protein [Ignavibacteriaceae bacterium]MCZ2143900.1 formylglycine-generating enzyme family protein [Ignavibacteriales bacterium]
MREHSIRSVAAGIFAVKTAESTLTTASETTAGSAAEYMKPPQLRRRKAQFPAVTPLLILFFLPVFLLIPTVVSGQGMELVFIEGGSFVMGCYDPSLDCDDDETELRDVTVYGFYISTTEISQGVYDEVMGRNISLIKEPTLPVNNVSWYDAIEFCNKLSLKHKLNPCYIIKGRKVTCNFSANGYRLPTEAEWEFAARGGNLSKGWLFAGSNDPFTVGWFKENSAGRARPSKQKAPNELGLFDMSGNLWEWCWDIYGPYEQTEVIDPKGAEKGGSRVLRGGSWYYESSVGRNSNRFSATPDTRSVTFGIRVVKKAG